jgi:hypothetical protein
MLAIAVQKNSGNVSKFVLQDFSTLQLPQPVDLITCFFDSLNYLLTTEDLLDTFLRFHANLNPSGHLLFDMITDYPPLQRQEPRFERQEVHGFTVERLTRWDPRRSIQSALVSISRKGSSYQEAHVERGYPIVTVCSLLAEAKFIVRGIHDFHTLKPASSRTSRAFYVAQVAA